MGALMDALGTVGSVMDAPRSAVYSALINPAYHALGGDPNQQIGHFSDLLGAAGMDKDSMLTKGLGMAGDMATDPLTYAGAFGGEALANMGFRAGEGALQAGRGAESMGSGAASTFKDLLSPVTTFKDVAPAAADAIPEMFDRAAGTVGSDAAGMTGRVVGGRQYMPGQIEGKFEGALGTADATQKSAGVNSLSGMYSPQSNSVLLPEGATPATARHEHIHAIIDQAAKSGETQGLPAMMRYPAQLQAAGGMDPSTLSGGFGVLGDELAAQSLQNRGTMNQIRGGADWLMNPQQNNAYSALYNALGVNPVAAGAYRAMRYVPGAAGAAAGGGVGALGEALGQ